MVPQPAQGEPVLTVHVVRVELDVFCFCNELVSLSGLLGQDIGVVGWDMIT
jgi:hypothetical protein